MSSVSDEVQRIQDNVTASLAAVAAKGVSVPTNATSDNLPSLISQISAGTTTQKTLWTGGWLCGAGKLDLSEAISAQPNGVVLVWSYSSNGLNPSNYSYAFDFVPKLFVENHPGAGIGFSHVIAGSGAFSKYLYFFDTYLNSYNGNASSTTQNGVTLNQSNWMLREVIGV